MSPVVVEQVTGQDVEHDESQEREKNKVRGLERDGVGLLLGHFFASLFLMGEKGAGK